MSLQQTFWRVKTSQNWVWYNRRRPTCDRHWWRYCPFEISCSVAQINAWCWGWPVLTGSDSTLDSSFLSRFAWFWRRVSPAWKSRRSARANLCAWGWGLVCNKVGNIFRKFCYLTLYSWQVSTFAKYSYFLKMEKKAIPINEAPSKASKWPQIAAALAGEQK